VILAGADIGGTKISLSLADADGIRVKLHQPTRLRGDPETVPRQVIELADRGCGLLGIHREELSALGVSAASPFEDRRGRRELATLTLCGGLQRDRKTVPNDWISIPLETVLREAFPKVEIENDCVSAVVAERRFGEDSGEGNLVYVTWSTGVGAGAFADGRLVKGKHGNALHLGYVLLSGGRPDPCDLPDFDRLEDRIGGEGLSRAYGEPPPVMFRRFRAGEARAIKLISWAARMFAAGLVNLTCLLDPAAIVVGGSIALHNWDILSPLVEEEYRAHYPVLTREVKLRSSALGEYLGDIAALSLVMPEQWLKAYRRSEPWRTAPAPLVLPPGG
jgi:glucokinase